MGLLKKYLYLDTGELASEAGKPKPKSKPKPAKPKSKPKVSKPKSSAKKARTVVSKGYLAAYKDVREEYRRKLESQDLSTLRFVAAKQGTRYAVLEWKLKHGTYAEKYGGRYAVLEEKLKKKMAEKKAEKPSQVSMTEALEREEVEPEPAGVSAALAEKAAETFPVKPHENPLTVFNIYPRTIAEYQAGVLASFESYVPQEEGKVVPSVWTLARPGRYVSGTAKVRDYEVPVSGFEIKPNVKVVEFMAKHPFYLVGNVAGELAQAIGLSYATSKGLEKLAAKYPKLGRALAKIGLVEEKKTTVKLEKIGYREAYFPGKRAGIREIKLSYREVPGMKPTVEDDYFKLLLKGEESYLTLTDEGMGKGKGYGLFTKQFSLREKYVLPEGSFKPKPGKVKIAFRPVASPEAAVKAAASGTYDDLVRSLLPCFDDVFTAGKKVGETFVREAFIADYGKAWVKRGSFRVLGVVKEYKWKPPIMGVGGGGKAAVSGGTHVMLEALKNVKILEPAVLSATLLKTSSAAKAATAAFTELMKISKTSLSAGTSAKTYPAIAAPKISAAIKLPEPEKPMLEIGKPLVKEKTVPKHTGKHGTIPKIEPAVSEKVKTKPTVLTGVSKTPVSEAITPTIPVLDVDATVFPKLDAFLKLEPPVVSKTVYEGETVPEALTVKFLKQSLKTAFKHAAVKPERILGSSVEVAVPKSKPEAFPYEAFKVEFKPTIVPKQIYVPEVSFEPLKTPYIQPKMKPVPTQFVPPTTLFPLKPPGKKLPPMFPIGWKGLAAPALPKWLSWKYWEIENPVPEISELLSFWGKVARKKHGKKSKRKKKRKKKNKLMGFAV